MNETELGFINYIEHFKMHYKLLLRRYKRFKEVDRIDNTDIDVITYLDIIVVQLRAMCIESPGLKKNYTTQNLLRMVKRDDLAKKIDDMLAEEFFTYRQDCDIRKAIKILADQYICHYDSIDDTDIVWAEIIEKQLRNPYEEHNLDYIMGVIIGSVHEGLSIDSVMKLVEIEEE